MISLNIYCEGRIYNIIGIQGADLYTVNVLHAWRPGVRFTKVFRTELGHKYILVECSVIALCLPVMSIITRYKLVCYK